MLRFYAYFKEGIAERRDENMRVRKCVLYYYLEDGTIHVGVNALEQPLIRQSGTLAMRSCIPLLVTLA